MLREVDRVRQRPGEPRRRWFTDATFDLIVWQDRDGAVQGFQLTYDKPSNEHALSWQRDRGFEHNRIDDGEVEPGRHKASPILVADGVFAREAVAASFARASAGIDPHIAAFVREKIREAPGAPRR